MPQAPLPNINSEAQQSLALAASEARRLNHGFVGTEHLLLGIVALGRGTAANVIQLLGVELETVRQELEKAAEPGTEPRGAGNIPYTPLFKKALAASVREAVALRHNYVGSEHFLLGLLLVEDGLAAKTLAKLGIDVGAARREILKELGAIREAPAHENVASGPDATPAESFDARLAKTEPVESGNFTPRAQQSLALARAEANRLVHNSIEPEHLLLGLIALGMGVAVNVLLKLGLDLDDTRAEVEKLAPRGIETQTAGKIAYTAQTKQVLAMAARAAKALGHQYVGTEHILLGLLRRNEGVAAEVFKHFEVDAEQVFREILRELDPNS